MHEQIFSTPYKPAFTAIERGSAMLDSFTPADAYDIYDRHVVRYRLDPKVYFMMALTSGGYGRDVALSPYEAMQKNMDFSFAAAPKFLQQYPEIDEQEIVLPSELGKVKGWNQADYLLFFFYIFTGAKPGMTREVDTIIRESGLRDLPSFSAPAEQRNRSDYGELVYGSLNVLESVLRRHGADKFGATNIQAGIFMNDKNGSFGTWAEGEFMRNIGIPPQVCHLDTEIVQGEAGDYALHRRALHSLGVSVLGSEVNRDHIQFIGVTQGGIETKIAYNAKFRKTGLLNLVLSNEYYMEHPEWVPVRHAGNAPVIVSAGQDMLFA